MIKCRGILVAIDFSSASDAALLYGRELAGLFKATLDVVHVVNDVVTTGALPGSYVPDMGNVQKEIEQGAREKLDELVRDDDGHRPRATTAVLTSPSPADSILEYIANRPIDLIVIGSHRHSTLGRLLLGSVAEKVVRFAPCPVLTVRSPERDFITPDALEKTAASH